MQHLLFLSHRIPYPPNKGDKIRSYHLLKHLSAQYRVHLGCFVDDADDMQHVDYVRSLCASCHIVPLKRSRATALSLRGFFRGEALTLPFYRQAGMSAWVKRTLQDYPISNALAFSSPMAQYLLDLPQALNRVIDFVDVDSDKWRQYSQSKKWPLSQVYRREASKLFDFERRVALECEATALISAAEAALFREAVPAAAERVHVVNNGVDTDYFTPYRDYQSPYKSREIPLVFTGAMDYWANVDAVDWFARHVFPAVYTKEPAARFYVVGARPTPLTQALAKFPGVIVTGAVEDVRPYLAHAALSVAPLRIARGTQNKVLEAMAMARVVIASPQATQGLELAGKSRDLRVAGDAAEFIAEILHWVEDRRARETLGVAARKHVLNRYSWHNNLAAIDRLLERRPEAPEAAQPEGIQQRAACPAQPERLA